MRNLPVRGMRKWARALCLAAVLCLLGPTTATTKVEITLIPKRDMKFGEFAASIDGGGTVVLNANADSVTWSGAITPFGGTVRRARFKIEGQPKQYVIVTLPSSITIRKGTSNHYMTVDNFTMDKTNPVRLNKSGTKTINIGATLHIGTNQRKGNYNDDNSFTYVVNYL